MDDSDSDSSEARLGGRGGGGDSGGGPYPGRDRGKGGGKDGFLGSGGQSEQGYHGHGRLGEQPVGDNVNAPAEKDGD